MASAYARELLADLVPKRGKAKVGVEYTVELTDSRPEQSISKYTFKMAQGIPEDAVTTSNLASLNTGLELSALGVIPIILEKLKINPAKVGNKRSTGRAVISTEEAVIDSREMETSLPIRGTSGRFMSSQSFKSILELLVKQYMMKEMTKGAPILVNRTGRFINTTLIKRIEVLPPVGRERKQRIEVSYSYMREPYRVFDPRYGNRLSSTARNPQRIIGEAIAKALRDLTNETVYNYRVKEVI